jgi:hypothetical protein
MTLVFLASLVIYSFTCGVNENRDTKKEYASKESIQDTLVTKKVDTTNVFYSTYSESCNSWRLSINDIELIIERSVSILPSDYHTDFDVLPCEYEVIFLENGDKILLLINAGGGVKKYVNGKFKEYLGCYESCGDKFLVEPWNGE